MLRNLLLIISLNFLFLTSFGQTHDQRIRLLVLRKDIVGKMFVFGKWSKTSGEEIHLTYLGKVTTRSGQILKILNSSWYWGLAHRATSRILVFDRSNRFIGDYYVTMVNDLPTSLENGKLIFHNSSPDCDNKLFSVIDLKKGLPKKIFRLCKDSSGDTYSFEAAQ